MTTTEPPIYVVVSSTGGEGYSSGACSQKHDGGPIVHETEVGSSSTLSKANARAAMLEKRWGPCRVARLVFENEPGFDVKA